MKHKNVCYDKRYKHKLNMLEPGLIMMKIIGVFFVFGIVCWVARWHWLSMTFWLLSGILFAALIVLVAIEAHQDNVLNDIAMQENNKLEKKYESR